MREAAGFSSGSHGAALAPAPEPRREFAVDADVGHWFEDAARRNGGDAESLMNAVLREYMCRSGEPLERTLRRVLREELRKAG